ncbi:2Fe-2S iron-sulfur cluster-binding protein [Neorhizobium alkalisoli]|uniref:2Fe-2S ferredoxin n=1 Tax=Neorhizobium alkalisoli TaxID=528178 RepID=A0A561QG62_9HYPH|nr:2Fe-2S iron-sulfur cluster-binding protein [Neorhizobium alkalisoli]TWF49363.1 2Fe-2S ferredoxin [Neorhizobium alkalisoli]
MPKVTFIGSDDKQTQIEVPVGHSLMEAAIHANINGILGECGGSANCATCHVYVESGNLDALPEVGVVEEEMLDATSSERTEKSRLSCQLFMTEALDGLVVRLPPTQA